MLNDGTFYNIVDHGTEEKSTRTNFDATPVEVLFGSLPLKYKTLTNHSNFHYSYRPVPHSYLSTVHFNNTARMIFAAWMKYSHPRSTPRKMFFRPSIDTSNTLLTTDVDPVFMLTCMQYDVIQTHSFVFHGRKTMDVH